MRFICPEKMEYLLHQQGNKLFGVLFFKKDKSLRHLVGRFGVHYEVKGERPSPAQPDNPYVLVWDVQKHGLRIVNLRTVLVIKAGGETYLAEGIDQIISRNGIDPLAFKQALEEMKEGGPDEREG